MKEQVEDRLKFYETGFSRGIYYSRILIRENANMGGGGHQLTTPVC